MDSGREEHRTGSIYTFARATARPSKSGWNTLEITLEANRILTAINGVPVAEFDSSDLKPQPTDTTGAGDPRGPRPQSGYIGLQNHDQDSVVFFKEVSVRPLTSARQCHPSQSRADRSKRESFPSLFPSRAQESTSPGNRAFRREEEKGQNRGGAGRPAPSALIKPGFVDNDTLSGNFMRS